MLAARAAENDLLGQWMGHHLAALVVAAQDDAATSVAQRQEIVELVLKVWAHRRAFEGRAPLMDFEHVFIALDRLGDERPWRFLRPLGSDSLPPDPDRAAPLLARIAVDLERLARETVIRLLWLAVKDAEDGNEEWLKIADQVAATMENDVASVLQRLQTQITRRYIDDAPAFSAAPAIDGDAQEPNRSAAQQEDRAETINQAERLREMARQLTILADLLEADDSTTEDHLD